MKCPTCRTRSMYVVEVDNLELDICATCQGAWFDAEELQLLVGSAGACQLTPADVVEDDRNCPRCRNTMDKANIGPAEGVTIDTCPQGCGLWFDRDEVHGLVRNLEAADWKLDPAVRAFLGEVFPESPSGD